MTTPTDTKRLTANDLLRLYSEGIRGELIRGALCQTMPTGQEHGEIVVNLTVLLGTYVKSRKLGRLTASDAGVWLERDPDTVREPEIAYFSTEKIPPRACGSPVTPKSFPTWSWKWCPQATVCERSTTKR